MRRLISSAENVFLHTYNRFPVVFGKGDGVYLYDTDEKKYLDFFAGIAVCGLGYGNERFTNAIQSQIDNLVHISNYFYSEPAVEAATKLARVSGMDRVFFTNSGTEAVEGALKMARKYAYDKGNFTKIEIIAVNHSFHGRSMGAVSVTGTDSYREPFGPMLDGVKFAEYNNIESIRSLITEDTCAIILETVQGEGGIYVAEPEFLDSIRSLCDEHDIVMILDEVQCGMGRTGTMFAYQQYNLLPDIITMAKGIGNGVPVGAFACREKFAALKPGDHGTTYGGSPLATAAVSAVIDIYEEDKLLEHVQEVGAYLHKRLDELMTEKECIVSHRGIGLMQGIELDCPVREIISRCIDEGLILISAGSNVIRFLPPLIIQKEHIDVMIDILSKVL